MKDIEAWLTQTEGKQKLSTDWQPSDISVSDLQSLSEDVAAVQPVLLDNVPTGPALQPLQPTSEGASAGLSVTELATGAENDAANQSVCDEDTNHSSMSPIRRLEQDVTVAGASAGFHNRDLPPVEDDDEEKLGNIGDEDYVDEKQLMEYLRQLEMERSEELLLLEATPPESSCPNDSSSATGTGARPKVRSFAGLNA